MRLFFHFSICQLFQPHFDILPQTPSGSPEDWGHEALMAEGLQNEHNANRYALALQAMDPLEP